MINKFKKNDRVKVTLTDEILIVKDFEFFDDFVLYYFDSKTAYREDQLTYNEENNTLKGVILSGSYNLFLNGFFTDLEGNPIFLE